MACHTSGLEANRHRQLGLLPSILRGCESRLSLIELVQEVTVCPILNTTSLCNTLDYSKLFDIHHGQTKSTNGCNYLNISNRIIEFRSEINCRARNFNIKSINCGSGTTPNNLGFDFCNGANRGLKWWGTYNI